MPSSSPASHDHPDSLAPIAVSIHRGWRRSRKLRAAAVTTFVAISLAFQQTGAYAAVERRIHEPVRVSLRPGVMALAAESLRRVSTAIGSTGWKWLAGLTGGSSGPNIMRPGGMPYPWQAADPSAPFSAVNLANGNLFTQVPVVSWGGLGGGISFSFFHNNQDPYYVTSSFTATPLPLGWTHSYSRHLKLAGPCDGLISESESRQSFFEEESEDAGEWIDLPLGTTTDPASESEDSPPNRSFTASSAPTGVTLITDDGRRIFFEDDGNGGFLSPPGIRLTLTTNGAKFTLTDAHQNISQFDSNGWLLNCTDASGNKIQMSYQVNSSHAKLRLNKVVDVIGNELVLEHDTADNGRISRVSAPPLDPDQDPTSRRFELTYDGDQLLSISKATRDGNDDPLFQCGFTYESDDLRFATISDYDGHATEITYDHLNDNIVSTVTHPAVYDFVEDEVINPVRTYIFSLNNESENDPCGTGYSELTTVTDERGHDTTYEFDAGGRLLTVTDPLSREVASLEWDAGNRVTQSTSPLGGTTVFDYDAADNLTSVTDPLSNVTTLTYDSINNLTSVTDALSQMVSYSYDDTANPTRVTAIDGVGNSDVLLGYGQTNGKDRGQLTAIQSSNQTQQQFSHEDGFLTSSFYGQFAAANNTIAMNQESFATNSSVGYPVISAPRSDDGGSGGTCSPPAPTCGFASYSTTFVHCSPSDPSGLSPAPSIPSGHVECGCSGTCSSYPDADGQASGVCSGSGNLSGASFGGYDGVGSPAAVTLHGQGSEKHATSNGFDALNRPTLERVQVTNDYSGTARLDLGNQAPFGFYMSPCHQIEREYADSAGAMRTFYSRPQPDGSGDRVIATEYQTDNAGRVSTILRDGQTIATYDYDDTTVGPAIVEHKPQAGLDTEYYLDAAGRVMMVLHIQDNSEIAGFVYDRDAKNRITQVEEFRYGVLQATLNYTYGDGHLNNEDLDANATVDPTKLYWSWLGDQFPQALDESDPNRLVCEQRTPADGADPTDAYRKEYWYDPAGNRLAMRESVWNETDFQVFQITRYNYTRQLADTLNPNNASDVPTGIYAYDTEPSSADDPVATDYSGNGMDRLISYHVYRPEDSDFKFVSSYNYQDFAGGLGLIIQYGSGEPTKTGRSGWFKKTTQLEHNAGTQPGRRQLLSVFEQYWSPTPTSCPANALACPEYAFAEHYWYDAQGRRIAKSHFADAEKAVAFNSMEACKDDPLGNCTPVYVYDYDGPNVLVERRSPERSNVKKDPYLSSYVWGPLGLICRNAEQENSCPDDDCHFYYLNDATGNCVGVVCGSTTGSCSSQPTGGGLVQWTRMDAFGNLIAEIYNTAHDSPLPSAVLDCAASQPSACVSTQPATLDKPQVLAGPYQYHGSQGYEADVAMPTRGQDSPPFKGDYAEPISRSTQFMHVGARYYEPATGRFLEYDPMPADPTPFSWGQQNRWVYCANDPVNWSDFTGEAVTPADIAFYGGAFLGAVDAKIALGVNLSIFSAFLAGLFSLFAGPSIKSALKGTCQKYQTGPVGYHAEVIITSFLAGYIYGVELFTMFALFDAGAAWIG